MSVFITFNLLQTSSRNHAHNSTLTLDMDFDSSLFDLPFEQLACLGGDAQQQQPPTVDFQDFCKDFATTDFATDDFAVEATDNQTPAWSFGSATDFSEMDAGIAAKSEDTKITAKSEDFLSSLDKSVFDPLEPFDSSFDNMFGSNIGNDAQVVPDMAPLEAEAPEFSMPTYTQTSYVPPKTLGTTAAPSARPYSWMNGMDYASFGWPARTRLPSENPCIHRSHLLFALQTACCRDAAYFYCAGLGL